MSQVIMLHIPNYRKTELKEHARIRGRTLSDIVRQAIEEWIDRNPIQSLKEKEKRSEVCHS